MLLAQWLDRRRDLVDQARRRFCRIIRSPRRDRCWNPSGIRPVAAASQGGLALIPRGRAGNPLEALCTIVSLILAELEVPVLDRHSRFRAASRIAEDYLRAAAALGEASELAATFGVRLALEFQKTSPFCACLETAMALIEQSSAQAMPAFASMCSISSPVRARRRTSRN